jgi:hypothetical protein
MDTVSAEPCSFVEAALGRPRSRNEHRQPKHGSLRRRTAYRQLEQHRLTYVSTCETLYARR